jgi:hypothetical protein
MAPHTVPPHGWPNILLYYGDPRRNDGTLNTQWEAVNIVMLSLPAPLPLSWDLGTKVTRMRVHRKVAANLGDLFEEIHRLGFWPLIRNFGGAYNYRPMRGSTKLSMHSFGAAIDLNTDTNKMGTRGDMSPVLVALFAHYGWTWGGNWLNPDPMHWQMGTGH